jgi:hypothetical protein
MDDRELASLLNRVVSDWDSIEEYIDKGLAAVKPLLPAEPAQDLIKRFIDDVHALGTVRLGREYVACMDILLVERFKGWDTEKFYPFLWRLLHEDVLATMDIAATKQADRGAAHFWLRVLSAIAENDVELDWEQDYDLHSDDLQTSNLRAHALVQLAKHMNQFVPFALRNKKVGHAWSALKQLTESLRFNANRLEDATEITINDDLNETWLLEWIVARTEFDHDVDFYDTQELKRLLLASPHRDKTLSGAEHDDRLGLLRLVEEARHDAEDERQSNAEEDEARYGSGSP